MYSLSLAHAGRSSHLRRRSFSMVYRGVVSAGTVGCWARRLCRMSSDIVEECLACIDDVIKAIESSRMNCRPSQKIKIKSSDAMTRKPKFGGISGAFLGRSCPKLSICQPQQSDHLKRQSILFFTVPYLKRRASLSTSEEVRC